MLPVSVLKMVENSLYARVESAPLFELRFGIVLDYNVSMANAPFLFSLRPM